MKTKKIVLFIALGIFIVLLIYFYFVKESYIIIGNHTKIKINDNKISVEHKNDKIFSSTAKVYFDKSFIPAYIKSEKISNDEYVYTSYSKNGDILDMNRMLLAIIGDYNINVGNPTIIERGNDKELSSVMNFLNENSISGDTIFYKRVVFDINSDGVDDDIYSVGVVNYDNVIISVLLIKKGDTYNIINRVEGNLDYPNHEEEIFVYLIDFNNDGIYEIVTSKITGDDSPSYANIYEYYADEYHLID